MSDATSSSTPLRRSARKPQKGVTSKSEPSGPRQSQANTSLSPDQPAAGQAPTSLTFDAARFKITMNEIQDRHVDAYIYSDTDTMDAEFAKLFKLTTTACAQAEKQSEPAAADSAAAEQKIKELEQDNTKKQAEMNWMRTRIIALEAEARKVRGQGGFRKSS